MNNVAKLIRTRLHNLILRGLKLEVAFKNYMFRMLRSYPNKKFGFFQFFFSIFNV